jgi:hypothetical protein
MKRSILIIAIALFSVLPCFVAGQSEQVAQLFDKFSDIEGFTSVDVSKGLFELFAEIEADDPDFDDFKKAIEGLESLKLLAYSLEEGRGDARVKSDFVSEINKTISFKDYQELMVIKESDAKINFYAKSDKQVIKEMIMFVDGSDEAVLLSLYGNIDLNYMAKLAKGMNMGGMEYLNRMDKK